MLKAKEQNMIKNVEEFHNAMNYLKEKIQYDIRLWKLKNLKL